MSSQPQRRTSDQELHELREQFQSHVDDTDRRFMEVMEIVGRNAEATERLAQSTADLVEAWNAANGAVKVAAMFGRVAKWVATVGAVIAGVVYFLKTGDWKI